jgi:membrane fusion protein (multidrug efflux system)
MFSFINKSFRTKSGVPPRFLIPALSFCLLSLSGCGGCGDNRLSRVLSAAPEVVVEEVAQKDVPILRDFVGQTQGYQDVEIRARVEGYLQSINFKDGSFVKKGDLLYQIDPKPFETALTQASADLAQAKAKMDKAQLDVNRFKPLVEAKAISRQELDTALAAFDAAKAAYDAAQAFVDQAKLNLGYTKITAPIDGLIDVTKVKTGNLVGRGENTLLTVISRINPILVRVSISEVDYLIFSKAAIANNVDPEKADEGPIELILADNSVHPHPGKLEYTERAVDSKTGTLTCAVAFPNPDNLLRPGQYAKVRGVTEIKKRALLIPQRAVRELQGTFSVAVVGKDRKVTFKTVTPGDRVGQLWIIEKGLNAGDQVVTEGIQKIQDGMTVTPKKPAADAQDTVKAGPPTP